MYAISIFLGHWVIGKLTDFAIRYLVCQLHIFCRQQKVFRSFKYIIQFTESRNDDTRRFMLSSSILVRSLSIVHVLDYKLNTKIIPE